MVSGQEKEQAASSIAKTDRLVKQFQELQALRERKLQEKAAKERDVETAIEAMKGIAEELKTHGITSTDELRTRISNMQTELELELAELTKELQGVTLNEV